MKTAYAMPCTTPEQAEEMKKLCEKHRIKVESNWGETYCVLTNNQGGNFGKVAFIHKYAEENYARTLIPYNPALFLYSLGVFPEKWAVRGSKEFVSFASSQKWDLRNVNGTYQQCFYYLVDNRVRGTSSPGNVIPFGYIEVTLEDLIRHYEKPKTNDMRKQKFVKCIETSGNIYITKGVEYLVIKENQTEYRIAANDGVERYYRKGLFEFVTEQPTPKLTITRTELLEIHSIACDWWKAKIEGYAKRLDLVTDTITFTESEVKYVKLTVTPQTQWSTALL